jgi:hypothetical protein
MIARRPRTTSPRNVAMLLRVLALAKQRRERVREVAYPLILHYINDCAAPDDKFKVTRPSEIIKDQYWGTEQEIENPRALPKGFVETKQDRKRFAQQIITERALTHIRAICRYYRIELNDLVGSAIAYAAEKQSGEAAKEPTDGHRD